MSSVADRNFGTSASVMRPTSPYLKAPPLAHSTTSAMACFLVVATRRAIVRNSLRSWLNPEALADPLPLLCAGGEAAPSAGGMVDLFPPFGVVLFAGNEGFAISFDAVAPSTSGLTDAFPPFAAELLSGGKGFVVGCGAVTAGIVSEGDGCDLHWVQMQYRPAASTCWAIWRPRAMVFAGSCLASLRTMAIWVLSISPSATAATTLRAEASTVCMALAA